MTRLAVLAALLATAIAAALAWHAKRNRITPFERFVRDSGFQAEAEAALAAHRRFREPYDRDELVALFV